MISDELLQFVREQLAANVPQEQIAAILKPGGWTEDDVAEAFKTLNVIQKPAVPVPSPSPTPQPKVIGINSSVAQTAIGQPMQSFVVPSSVATAPAQPEIKTQFQTAFRLQTMPSAPVSGRKWPIIIVSAVLFLLLAGAGVWYFLYRPKTPVVLETPSRQTMATESENETPAESPMTVSDNYPFDQDLLVNWTKIPDEQNGISEINAAAGLLTKADTDFLSKYFGKGYDIKNLPAISAANAVAARNVKTLQAFATASAKPLYQCSVVMTPSQCNFESVRNIGRLLLLRSYVLEKAGKIPEAISIAISLVDLGRKVTANADEVVQLLVGLELQEDGYRRVAGLKPKISNPVAFSEDEKAGRIATLLEEYKNVFKFMYTRQAEVLEYLADKNKVPSFPQSAESVAIAEEYRKSIALGEFNLEETKKYFYDSYKTAIANVDVACGSPLVKAPYDFSAEVNTVTTTSNQSSIENYVGKILYWTTYTSWDSLNVKRCEIEDLINNP